MDKFEYDIVRTDIHGDTLGQPKIYIDKLGKDGWELVSVSGGLMYFKRKLP